MYVNNNNNNVYLCINICMFVVYVMCGTQQARVFGYFFAENFEIWPEIALRTFSLVEFEHNWTVIYGL